MTSLTCAENALSLARYKLSVGPYLKLNKHKPPRIHDTFYSGVFCFLFSVARVLGCFAGFVCLFFPCFCGFQTYIPKFQLTPEFHFHISRWLMNMFVHTLPGNCNADMLRNIFSPPDSKRGNDTALQPVTPAGPLSPAPFWLPHNLSSLPSDVSQQPPLFCHLA